MQPFHKKANTGAPLSFGEGKGLPAETAGVRVILYSPQTLPSIGGLQYVVHYWAEALSKKGYQVTVISETPEQPNAPSKPQRGDSPIRGVQPYDDEKEKEGQPQRGDSPIRGVQPHDPTHQPYDPTHQPYDPTHQPHHPTYHPHTHPHHPTISADDALPPPSGGGSGWGPLILRNTPFRQQVAAMRAADKVIMFNVSLKGIPAWLLSGKALYLSHHTALWYDGGSRPWQQRLKQWVANYMAKKNCACSGYIASLYKSCEVIYSPFRSDVFTPGTTPRIPGSILFAGRLVSDKGADLLLEACAILKAKRIAFSLTIVGDGPDREKLIALAEQLKIYRINASAEISSEPVSPLAGGPGGAGSLPQPHLVRLMQTSQIMVVPSRMEPMGMVVAEGLACGCRMVVSNQGGMPEVGGPFCHYFESGNPAALAAAIETALTNPLRIDADDLHAHLQQFTIDHSVAKLEEWLK